MREDDGRKLDHRTLEALRLRAVEQVARGVPAAEVGAELAALGLHRRTIYTWLATERTEGHEALRARPVPGRPRKLTEEQLGELAGLIAESDPRAHGFAVALWTREVVRQLIAARFGVQLTVASVGLTLHNLGFSAQRPLYRAEQADPVAVARWREIEAALAQLPGGHTRGKRVLVPIDGAGGTHELLAWLTRRRLSYSVGFSLPGDLAAIQAKLAAIPDDLWEPAYDADGQPRDGAFVAEVTDLFDLSGWPPGMRLIVRKERPHPGAQLRITDLEGMRITAFVTNTTRGQLADLELRHRRRARAEDRIRCAKDTGLANLPLHDFAANQIWCALVALAGDLLAWMQTLALVEHQARRWEPKRLRLRLLSIPARHARTGRRRLLHLAPTAPFTALALHALDALAQLTAPALADTG